MEAQYSQGYTLWGSITDDGGDTETGATVTLTWSACRVNGAIPIPGSLTIGATNSGWGPFPCHWFGVDHFKVWYCPPEAVS